MEREKKQQEKNMPLENNASRTDITEKIMHPAPGMVMLIVLIAGLLAGIALALTAAISIAGILVYKKIIQPKRNHKQTEEDDLP